MSWSKSLEQVLVSLSKRFENNLLKDNADKCNFLVSNDQEVTLNVDFCPKYLKMWKTNTSLIQS